MDIPSFEELFRQIKQNLWAVGIPYNDFKFKLRYHLQLICLWLMVLSECLFLISKISAENLLELTNLAPCTCMGILSGLKIMAIAGKRKNIYKLTESLKQLYTEAIRDKDKRAILQPNATLLQFIKYFFILNWILIALYSFLPAFLMIFIFLKYHELQFLLPYPLYLPFEVDGWISWGPIFLFSTFAGYICTLYFTTADIMYYVLTSQICGNMMLITSKIKKLDASGSELLQEIVKDHQIILKLADDMEEIYSAPNLFNVLIGSIQICALGFNLTTGELKQMPGYILFLVSVLLQILMMSVFGENIITESLNIGHAAYASNWYKMDQKAKKNILTILIRSGKPQNLTAYKFSVIGYESFAKIISTSWTYFTILQTVYSPTVD